jgi:hypothetical protein
MLQLKELAAEGYLERDWPRHLKHSKHSSYCRTAKADDYMRESPRRTRSHFKHQILDDMDTLSIEFGVDDEKKKFRLDRWPQIMASGVDARGVREAIAANKNPHRVPLPDVDLVLDGAGPLMISTPTAHMHTVKEIDRDTEGGHNHSDTRRRTIVEKVRSIHTFVKTKKKDTNLEHWKYHYGLDKIFVRWITINETRKREILRIIKEEISSCKFMGVLAWRDWGNHEIEKGGEKAYPAPDGFTFTAPYERVGNEPYYLNKFFEMDK